MQCPPLCWMLCIYSHQYPLNSNIKTAQVSPSLALRQLSTPHCTSTIGYASNQCLDQSPLADTVFRQYVYFGLDPSPSASPSLFFFSLPFIHGAIFLSPTVTSSPEAFFSWEAERACIAFSNEEEGFAFFISSLLFTCCPAPCVPALSLFHLLTNSSSCTLSFTLDLSFLFLSFYTTTPFVLKEPDSQEFNVELKNQCSSYNATKHNERWLERYQCSWQLDTAC